MSPTSSSRARGRWPRLPDGRSTIMSVAGAEGAQRADAQRNRRLLLEAAAQAFSEGGIDVSAGEIARRAGVAKGTLFRHFPTKSDLLAAVLSDRMGQLREL